MNNSIPPGSSRLGVSKVIEGIVYVFAKEHREKGFCSNCAYRR